MEKVHHTYVSRVAVAAVFAFLCIWGTILKGQFSTAWFTPEGTCGIMDVNTFLMADMPGEVGAGRYSSAMSLSSHIEITTKFKLMGTGSAGYVIGTVPSIPVSAFSTTTGGWPSPAGKIMIRMDRGVTASSLKLIISGATVYSLPLAPIVMGTCQEIKLNLDPGESGAPGHIRVALNGIPRVDYALNYKAAVFGGASTTNLRLWGVCIGGAGVYASFNGVCATETAVVSPAPSPAPIPVTKPAKVKSHKASRSGLVIGAAFAVIVTVSDAIFGKHQHSRDKLALTNQ